MSHQTTTNLATQDYFTTTLTGNVGVSDTVINLAAVPSGTEGYLVIDPTNASTREVLYYNAKGASTVTCPDATSGSSRGLGGTTVQTHNSGTLVAMNFTSEHFSELQNGNANLGLVNHQQAGHAPTYVVSGLVFPTSASLTATLASGVAYINGKRFTLSSASVTVTASKDTYLYIKENGDGTTSLVQSNVANNAASPAATINSDGSAALLVAIAISSGSAITTVNQGSPSAVLPIASSVAYSITDSLGNLIYPTSPTLQLIGYRQIVANTSSGNAAVAPLSAPAIIPAGRNVKISFAGQVFSGTTGQVMIVEILKDGSQIQSGQVYSSNNTNGFSCYVDIIDKPTIGIHTYSITLSAGGGTTNLGATSTNPCLIKVELV